MAAKLLTGLLLLFALLTFAAKNGQIVEVSYYFGYAYSVKLWVATFTSFGLGLILAGIGWFVAFLKYKNLSMKYNSETNKLKKEIDGLKQAPLPDEPSVYPPQTEEPVARNPIKILPMNPLVRQLEAEVVSSDK